MHDHEKEFGKMNYIILNEVFYNNLVKESLFPKLFERCSHLYYVPYAVKNMKEDFIIR